MDAVQSFSYSYIGVGRQMREREGTQKYRRRYERD